MPRRRGFFYLPTVLGDVPPDAPILGVEILIGPVAPDRPPSEAG